TSLSRRSPLCDRARYDAGFHGFVGSLGCPRGSAVGLTFSGTSFLPGCPLSSDLSAVKSAPPFMRPENVPEWFGGTEIGRALRGYKTLLLDRPEGDRMIVLVTDGDSSDLHGGNAEAIARELKENRITGFAIIIAMSQIQEEIYTITQTTGGEAFLAGDPEALHAIFRRIDHMKQAPLEKKIADTLDFFQPFCVAGLALLGLATLTSFGLRYTAW